MTWRWKTVGTLRLCGEEEGEHEEDWVVMKMVVMRLWLGLRLPRGFQSRVGA